MAIRAILFDVDGTLYSQTPLRLYMFARLTIAAALNPEASIKTLTFLRAYRKAQEHLRNQEGSPSQQFELSCQRSGVGPEFARHCIDRWIVNEPLPVIGRLVRPGVRSFLDKARSEHIKLGVVSDYPAVEKLEAMGLRDYFEVIVSAQQPDVGCFKPSAKGLTTALHRLNVSPHEAVYVGDRAEVDAEAAARANMSAFIVCRDKETHRWPSCQFVPGFDGLKRLIFGASH